MSRIKVLHYLRHLGLGGTEKTCQLFFEHLNSNEFASAVVYERTGDHPRIEEFAKAARVCRGELFVVDSYKDKKPNPAGLQECLDDFDPDIVHVYRSGYSEFPEPGLDIKPRRFVETNVFGFLDQNALVDKTLFMSKWLMNAALRGRSHKRFDYINNPVEEPYTDQKLPVVKWIRNPDVIIAGRCGRPDNGIYNAVSIRAIAKLRQEGYDIRFIAVAPPGNMVGDLEKLNIPFHIINPTTDPLVLSAFYNTVDIYTHARADGETFGVNIAEAMIHSKPVITHVATPSFPGMGVFQSQTELVDHGSTGLIVNNDVDEYTAALRLLADNVMMRESMGVAGFQKAVREYHVDACTRKLEKIYKEVVGV